MTEIMAGLRTYLQLFLWSIVCVTNTLKLTISVQISVHISFERIIKVIEVDVRGLSHSVYTLDCKSHTDITTTIEARGKNLEYNVDPSLIFHMTDIPSF